MAFQAVAAQHRRVAPRLLHLRQVELRQLAVVEAEVVAADAAAESLAQSHCIARSSKFRCGSDFQDRTNIPGLIFLYAQPRHELLDSP